MSVSVEGSLLLGVGWVGDKETTRSQELVLASEGQSGSLRTFYPNSVAGSVPRSPELNSRSVSYRQCDL